MPKCRDESRTSALSFQRSTCSLVQTPVVLRADIGEGMLFPVSPDVFNGVQLWRIAGEVLHHKRSPCSAMKSGVTLLRWAESRSQMIKSRPGMWRSRACRKSTTYALFTLPWYSRN